MGLGDELMAMGEARALHEKTGKRVVILNLKNQPRWHELWAENDFIVRPGSANYDDLRIKNSGGCRPYIDYRLSRHDRWAFLDYTPVPAQLACVKPDAWAEGSLLIEPCVKVSASSNKQWGRWQELVEAYPRERWLQVGQRDTRWLKGVRRLVVESLTGLKAVLTACELAVLPEGGLHHLAAALGKRCVILYGAYITPRVTGYKIHENLWVDDPEAVGWKQLNKRCESAWQQITPDDVWMAVGKVRQMLSGSVASGFLPQSAIS